MNETDEGRIRGRGGSLVLGSPRARKLLVLTLVAQLVLTVAAADLALRSIGAAFPSMLIDPWAQITSLSPPSWGATEAGLRYPDRVLALEGVALPSRPSGGVVPSRVFYDRLRELRSGEPGLEQVRVLVDGEAGRREVVRPIREISRATFAFFFAVYALAGLFLLSAGVSILALTGRRETAMAFFAWSASGHLLFTCFYDFHTSTGLLPFFPIGVMGFQAALLWIAFLFPRPPCWAGRGSRIALSLLTVALMGVGGAIAVAPWIGWNPVRVQQPASLGLAVSSLVLALASAARWKRAASAERVQLRIVFAGLGLTLVTTAALVVWTRLTGDPYIHLAAPFLFLFLPVSVGYALIRHDLLRSSAILSRRLLLVPAVLSSALVGVVVWLLLRLLLIDPLPWVLAILAAAGTLGGLLLGISRTIFRAAGHFRPTIEELADHLGGIHGSPEIPRAIELAISRWLSSDGSCLVPRDEVESIAGLPEGGVERLAAGEQLWAERSNGVLHLLVPMRSHGVLRGVLDIPPKEGNELFTEEDLALLSTIASLGAISLHNTEVQRLELELSRGSKLRALGLLGAQVAHEIAHPLNFFRGLISDLEREIPLDPDEVEMAREEIDRLERMLTSLRRLEPPPLKISRVSLHRTALHAHELIRGDLQERHGELVLDVPEGLSVRADPDPLLQILINLLRNGAQHLDKGGKLGIRAAEREEGLILDVWNTGPEIPEAARKQLFTSWFTTRSQGTGLGLNIVVDLIGRLQWEIDHHREGDRTVFRITIPRSNREDLDTR